VAIVQPAGADAPTLDELQAHARAHLAGYKLPRDLIVVGQVRRRPTGKADLLWERRSLPETSGHEPCFHPVVVQTVRVLPPSMRNSVPVR
jgi:hypothetical protein